MAIPGSTSDAAATSDIRQRRALQQIANDLAELAGGIGFRFGEGKSYFQVDVGTGLELETSDDGAVTLAVIPTEDFDARAIMVELLTEVRLIRIHLEQAFGEFPEPDKAQGSELVQDINVIRQLVTEGI